MSGSAVAFVLAFLLGGVCGALGMALAVIAGRAERGPETPDRADPQFQAGYRYGLMIGHERGMRDAEAGRVA